MTDRISRITWGRVAGERDRARRLTLDAAYRQAVMDGNRAYWWAHDRVLWARGVAYTVPRVAQWPCFDALLQITMRQESKP